MGIENLDTSPGVKREEEIVEGAGFVMGGKRETIRRDSSPTELTQVEFRPGATNVTEIEAREKGSEPIETLADADHAEDLLRAMLQLRNPYSETFAIKPDGKLNKTTRLDGTSVYLGYGDTPAELQTLAGEIAKKHPEYRFSFQTDPDGKWLKYTVSRS